MLSDEEPTFHRLEDNEIKTHTKKSINVFLFSEAETKLYGKCGYKTKENGVIIK